MHYEWVYFHRRKSTLQEASNSLGSVNRVKPILLTLILVPSIICYTVIHPAETHPQVILYAIASREPPVAQAAAKRYHFTKAYGSYQELLDDELVDIVYVSTPNGLHFEWAAKAMEKGKHVLCEKPFTANGEEAKRLVELAAAKGVILEEAV